MFFAALRTFAAILAGLVVAFILVVGVEFVSNIFHPFPEGVEQTTEAICRHVENYPPWLLAMAVPAWSVAAFAGVWTAMRLGSLRSAAIVGLLVLAGFIFNISKLPYPLWFKVAIPLAVPVAMFAGVRVWQRKSPKALVVAT